MNEKYEYYGLSPQHESGMYPVQKRRSTRFYTSNFQTSCSRRAATYLMLFFLAVVLVVALFKLSTFTKGSQNVESSHIKSRLRRQPYIDEVREVMRSGEEISSELNELKTTDLHPEPWREPKLFDLDFTWVKNNEDICIKGSEEDIQLMPVLVHTARSHFEERLVMREAWGSIPIYKKWDIRFVFLMGLANTSALTPSELEEEEKRLVKEKEDFGDIVMGNFIDSYENLTYKHLMGYKWVLNFCREATFVLKVDDDVFIDIMTWLDWRTADMHKLEKDPTIDIPDLYCKIWPNPKPFRKTNSKWYVPYDVWPDEYYPDFCSGWAYTLSVDLIEKLYIASYDVKFNWIDDVYVTGLLMETLKEKYEFVPEIKNISPHVTLYTKEYKSECEKGDLQQKRQFKVVAKVDRGEYFERDMMCMWNKVLYDRSLLN